VAVLAGPCWRCSHLLAVARFCGSCHYKDVLRAAIAKGRRGCVTRAGNIVAYGDGIWIWIADGASVFAGGVPVLQSQLSLGGVAFVLEGSVLRRPQGSQQRNPRRAGRIRLTDLIRPLREDRQPTDFYRARAPLP